MQFLSDENIYLKTVKFLRNLGYKVATTQELDLRGVSDTLLLEEAIRRKSILVSRDTDYLDLAIFYKFPHHGVIVLRICPDEEENAHQILKEFLQEKRSLKDRLVVINSLGYKIEKRIQ